MDSSSTAIRFTHTALLRLQPHFSMEKHRMFSNTAMTVVRAAKDMNTKNRAPHSCPMGISLNTLGRVMKIRLGPESGATSKAKQAGKMMSPAVSATQVSRVATRTASPARECSLPT